MKLMQERIELERRKAKAAYSQQNRMAKRITRTVRKYVRMKLIRRVRLHRLSATAIQCAIRCMFARGAVRAIRDKNAFLRHHTTRIQCAFRQHLARRRVALFAKLAVVKMIMAGWEEDRERQREEHRVDGAANTIARYAHCPFLSPSLSYYCTYIHDEYTNKTASLCSIQPYTSHTPTLSPYPHYSLCRYYRGSKIRENIKKIIFWNRYDKVGTPSLSTFPSLYSLLSLLLFLPLLLLFSLSLLSHLLSLLSPPSY